jgi:peptidoglycan/LPS O-acetylase OafA/YrhL
VENPRREHIPGLDGIRALAFLMVYFSHMGWGHSFTGGTGVSIFFFLSGYLITTLLRFEKQATATISIFEFYVRRSFRIFPPFYLTVFLSSLLFTFHLIGGSFSWKGICYVLFYWANFRLAGPHFGWLDGLAVTWSLSVEEHFYLIFPVFYLCIFRLSPKKQAAVFATLCGLGLLWRSILAHGLHASSARIYLYTDTRFDSILLGCLLAVLANPRFDSIPRWFRASPRLMAGLGVIGVMTLDHIPKLNAAFSYTLVGISLFPVFWYAIQYSSDPYSRWLNSSWLTTIGKWSYALYLGHEVIISVVQRLGHLKMSTASIVAIPLVLVYGFLMSKLVERPSNRLRNRFLRWYRKPKIQSVTEPSYK